MKRYRRLLLLAAVIACDGARAGDAKPLFELLKPEDTGINFTNQLPEDSSFNLLNYLYYYDGGGVAAGDVNNDGLPDLFFTSNLGADRLYLNRGNYRFEDVTARAGVAGTDGWTTGVTMADVNGDGHLDIYVSGVSYLTMHGRNVLYINNGDATFTERTREHGLEHVGYSTQAAFFDADADGDLDMYLLNHSTHSERGVSARPQREGQHPRAGDRLFRNDGGRFVDVTARAGIYSGVEGYGLGVVASDLNLDGCIDLFVANDFQENDFLYYNNCDGTFTESIAKSMGHTSRSSMGVDAADFDNDGRPDLMVLDMLPERESVLKTSANAESFNVFNLKVKAGYHPQYGRNTLQLNRGAGRFSEIGFLAGVHATDWSWSTLFADLDNDGLKDIFVTNGIYRRPNDLDYIDFVSGAAIQASLERGIGAASLALLKRMPQIPLASVAFRNRGDLTFANVAPEWGLDQPGFSNGAVYVDLNNSGALDLVVNTINAPARVYRNRGRELTGHHFLQVALDGAPGNTGGIGARVTIFHGGTRQMAEQMPTRGFQSSVDNRLHFGLGSATAVDSLEVVWPDGRRQQVRNVAADSRITLAQSKATRTSVSRSSLSLAARPMFTDVTRATGITYRHRENEFVDSNREPLMPHLLSTEGPALATGDVNGDGLDDIYVGGAKWQSGQLFVQRRDGTFQSLTQRDFRADSLSEDVDAAFFDADGDRDLDLYVVSGGNEFSGDDEALRDRLYRNDGSGNFTRDASALPSFFHNGSCVAAADFDRDGDVDLYVGSRVVSGAYGEAPRGYLLENDGRGRFRDVTADKAPSLVETGMATSAAWLDTDANGTLDLVVVGEWMPVRVFGQERGGRFVDRTDAAGLGGSSGWWNHVSAADLNADGRQDLVLGNLGLNSYIKASKDEPARLYVHDFGRNGGLEQILTFYKNGVSYPVADRDEIIRSIPTLRSKYPSYASFGASRVEDMFPPAELKAAQVLEARTFATSIAINQGGGAFRLQPLPAEAQIAPVNASIVDDFDADGRPDILLAGNFFGATPMFGRYDASYGTLLRNVDGSRFESVDLAKTGLHLEGQVRDVKWVRNAAGARSLVVARNNESLVMIRPPSPSFSRAVRTERGTR